MRRTVAQAKASRIPICLNLSASDSRFLPFLNAGMERLLHEGHWWGTTQKYTVSLTNQLMSLPPQFATIETVAVSRGVISVRDLWYEFAEAGWGVRSDSDLSNNQAIFRGNFPVFSDLVAPGKKLRFQCDVAADIGKTVLALGVDDNGNRIRTQQGGVWADGELITLAQSPGTLSTNNFAKLTDIQKPVTAGQVWLYEWDGVVNRPIGQYQYFETNPHYPRYLLPVIPNNATTVDLIGKMAFIPVVNDTDYLLIGHLEALRLACMAIKEEEDGNLDRAAILMRGRKDKDRRVLVDGALTLLEKELDHYKGSGVTPTVNFVNSGAGADDPVPCII